MIADVALPSVFARLKGLALDEREGVRIGGWAFRGLFNQSATVVRWHRQGFWLYWRWRSRSGRPSVDREVRDLIRQMNSANPLWGAPRIHGEL